MRKAQSPLASENVEIPLNETDDRTRENRGNQTDGSVNQGFLPRLLPLFPSRDRHAERSVKEHRDRKRNDKHDDPGDQLRRNSRHGIGR